MPDLGDKPPGITINPPGGFSEITGGYAAVTPVGRGLLSDKVDWPMIDKPGDEIWNKQFPGWTNGATSEQDAAVLLLLLLII